MKTLRYNGKVYELPDSVFSDFGFIVHQTEDAKNFINGEAKSVVWKDRFNKALKHIIDNFQPSSIYHDIDSVDAEITKDGKCIFRK